jgi:hypothetical protein
VLEVGGDVNLDDGGTFTTTLQTVTPTANRTISFPNATGTVALTAGSSGQLVVNQSGAYAGVANSSVDNATGNITLGSRFISSLNGALSATGIAGVPFALTGTWIGAGGTSTTTKPQVLIEPTGTTSTGWSTSGTGLGVNAASGFAGNLLDLQVNGTSRARLLHTGALILIPPDNNPTQGLEFFTSAGTANGAIRFVPNTGVLSLVCTTSVDITVGFLSLASDTRLFRDAAHNLAQRNATNAQTFRVYGTFTDASNHVRAALSSTSTAVTLAAETAGTGADDIPLNLTAAGTGTVKVNSNLEVSTKDIVTDTTTGTKIGTATTQKLGFYNATPVVQPAAVANITTTATAGTLPTPDGTVTIADATTPTVTELLEYCVELESKLEAALGHLRTLGLIAT